MRLSALFAKRWSMALAGLLAGLMLVARVWLFPVYHAEALLMIDLKNSPVSVETRLMGNDLVERMMRMHVYLLTTDPVLEPVVREFNLAGQGPAGVSRAIDQLRWQNVTITSPVFTNLIKISVRHGSPSLAAGLANAVAQSYQRWFVEAAQQEADLVLPFLEQKISETRAAKTIGQGGSPAPLAQADTLRFLQQEKIRAEMQRDRKTTSHIRWVSRARTPYQPAGRKKGLLAAAVLGVFFGLLYGVAAVGIDRMRLLAKASRR